jgi:hypothetical protein
MHVHSYIKIIEYMVKCGTDDNQKIFDNFDGVYKK